MRRVFAAVACALGALALVGPAGAGVRVGVNDDAGKYADGAPEFWQTMRQDRLRQNAVTVLWDEARPTTIVDESFIANALPAAEAAGVEVVFDVYPMHSQAFTQNGATPQQFGDFLAQLAQRFPSVTEYVLMNECNQTRFVNPQFDARGVNQSAAICGRALAAGYDALKAVDPAIVVWGVGLSPRGNDNAQAASNASTSPVAFLAALGKWYRSSGRTEPIMDGFDFHPYPIPQSLPFATGYADPDNVAVSNLPRIYQAFYDAFQGTAQPTIGQQVGGGLPVSLNEVGIQTDATGREGYSGTEVSGDGNGGVRGDTATEAFQASWYLQMLAYVACDPNVEVVNLFHLVDESALEGWQSGLYFVGYAPKASAAAVSDWIARTGGDCAGPSKGWIPARTQPRAAAALPPRLGALLAGGAFDGLRAGSFGPLGRYVALDGAALYRVARSFGRPDKLFADASSSGDAPPAAWTAGYVALARALVQRLQPPRLTTPTQAAANLVLSLLGPMPRRTSISVGAFACRSACAPGLFARRAVTRCGTLGLCMETRTTASARALRPVAAGSTTMRTRAAAHVRVIAVSGAVRAYGRHVVVVRVVGSGAAPRPAAFAVTFTVANAKPQAPQRRPAPKQR
jgi:hypothetical protein